MKKTRKAMALTSALATTALCASLVAGSTFALFSSSDSVDIAVTSGNVSVTAEIVRRFVACAHVHGKGNDGDRLGKRRHGRL